MRSNKNKINLKFLILPVYIVLAMWIVFWIEVRWRYGLSHFGILPGSISGLRGVLFGPFLHGSLEHLFNNSVPIIVLTSALLYFYPKQALRILIFGTILTGLGTWAIGRPAYHIGASGVVYMLTSYLLFQGLISRNIQLISISLIVVFFYGSLIWYLFPIDPKISWEGHSSGFAVGIILALMNYKNLPKVEKKYHWEKEDYNPSDDIFMQHFDSNGNFHPTEHWYNSKPSENSHTGLDNTRIEYHYESNDTKKQNYADEQSRKE
ncbi:MAG TPA: rhomboid family intramembrane serine protease [Flavobacteriaceae bacterium]|nr:rhomboid family intramembrane serine protease [Flavobacteriaceae bacterium]